MRKRTDAERIQAQTPPGLAGAIRVWLVAWLVSEFEAGARQANENGTPAPAAHARS